MTHLLYLLKLTKHWTVQTWETWDRASASSFWLIPHRLATFFWQVLCTFMPQSGQRVGHVKRKGTIKRKWGRCNTTDASLLKKGTHLTHLHTWGLVCKDPTASCHSGHRTWGSCSYRSWSDAACQSWSALSWTTHIHTTINNTGGYYLAGTGKLPVMFVAYCSLIFLAWCKSKNIINLNQSITIKLNNIQT